MDFGIKSELLDRLLELCVELEDDGGGFFKFKRFGSGSIFAVAWE